MKMNDGIKRLNKMKEQAQHGGGEQRIKKQHEAGKLTARERLNILLDQNSFQEFDAFVTHRIYDFGMQDKKILGDGVITGIGKVNGRSVAVFSHDFTAYGGTLSETFGQKVNKIMDLALKMGIPIIGLNDSGGARIQEGVVSLAAYAEIFWRNTQASGVIPQISAIMGPCAGGAVYSPALTDFIFMVKGTSYMFITGPEVVKTVTHEEVTFDELGGAQIHASKSGVAHCVTDNDEQCMNEIRKLLSYIPLNNLEEPPFIESDDEPNREDEELNSIIPDDPNKPYRMKDVLLHIVDRDSFFEIHKDYAQNIIVGFARLDGQVVGLIAQEPSIMAGVLDIHSSIKASRFIRFCDCFNIPIITFEDVPGFLPGVLQEHGGIIKHGAKLLYAYCEATVPKITIITRKSYGGAYCVLGSKQVRADINLAWPTAELAVMGPEGAVNITYRKEISEAQDSKSARKQLIDDYRDKFANPYIAAARGYVDDIIEPKQTRRELIKYLNILKTKRDKMPPKKHGNIPL